MAHLTEIDEEIVKPRTDKREYRRIVLGNSLQVLLICDPDTDKSAACMYVSIGHLSDPDGCEGLAHLLMRMLPYSSEKYPWEDSFSEYISEHGGYTNSVLYAEWTSYFFDISNDCFEEALERFSQFFIKPLMSAEAATREITTIESAYQNDLLSDGQRMYQLQKHLSRESHPFHRCGAGNWYTLNVQPKAKGLDIRHELLKFYEANYSANLMHLVVYTKGSSFKLRILILFQKFHLISFQLLFESSLLLWSLILLECLKKALIKFKAWWRTSSKIFETPIYSVFNLPVCLSRQNIDRFLSRLFQ